MGDNKRYYWLKLPEDFYDDDTIQWLMEQENGGSYVIFYQSLMLKSLKDRGYLIRCVGNKLVPYDVKALAKLTGVEVDTVRVAMELFKELGLIEVLETGEIYMSLIDEMIGSETDSARRMRKLRAREKNLAIGSSEYEVIDDDDDVSNNGVTDVNNESTNDKQSDASMSHSDKVSSHNDKNGAHSDNSVNKSDTDIDKDNRYRVRVRERHNIEKSQNDVPQLGFTNTQLVHNYFYSDIKANSDKSDSKYVYKAIDKYGWEEVLVIMIKLKEDQGAIINTFKYVETALDRNHENYMKNKSDNEWMANQRMDKLRTEQVKGLVDTSRS